MRLCVACPAARAGVSSGGTGAPTGSQRPLSPPRLLQALLRDPQERTICQATLWASRGNTFSLVSQHMFLFFLTSQTTREGAGSRKRPRFGTLLESLAGKDGRNRRDRVPWNAAFHSHHRRETGCIRGCGAGTQASSFSHSPTRSTHTYMLRSRTPSSPPESPQPHGESQESLQCGQRGALGWRRNRYRQGPSGCSKPAWEEGSSRCQQERLGTRGPCITTQRAPQGRRKRCPYRLRTVHKEMEARHQREQMGLIWKRPQRPLKDAHVSKGALLASWAQTEEKVVTLTPRGSAFSLEQKGPRDSLAAGRSTS